MFGVMVVNWVTSHVGCSFFDVFQQREWGHLGWVDARANVSKLFFEVCHLETDATGIRVLRHVVLQVRTLNTDRTRGHVLGGNFHDTAEKLRPIGFQELICAKFGWESLLGIINMERRLTRDVRLYQILGWPFP